MEQAGEATPDAAAIAAEEPDPDGEEAEADARGRLQPAAPDAIAVAGSARPPR